MYFQTSAEQLHKRHLNRRQQPCASQTQSLGSFDSLELSCPEDFSDGEYYGDPGVLYYGFQQYDDAESGALGWDAAMANVDQNGFVTDLNAITQTVADGPSWDTCICYMENGQWYSTGSLQYSWDNTYNGFSNCWAANCGG